MILPVNKIVFGAVLETIFVIILCFKFYRLQIDKVVCCYLKILNF